MEYSKNPQLRTRIFPSQPKQVLTEMVTSTNLGYLGSYFLKKKQIIAKSIQWYSAYSLIKSAQVFSSDSLIKSAYHYIQLYRHCSWTDNSSKRILNAHLFAQVTLFLFIDFTKKEPVSNFRLNMFLYRRGLTGKFQLKRLKNNVLISRVFTVSHCPFREIFTL